jgi:predicted amidohydrolase
VLARAGGGEAIVSADFDLTELEKIRASIPVFRDRRPDLYELD